ncbi:hypothetical protein [Bradyrhizobium sp.]|uniref:hypothetical protein n=1 Tax=Bradyrhizobium sp. TaxID=376 RepID=UPI003C77D3C7
MSGWNVIVESVVTEDSEPRFAVTLFKPTGARPWIKGPDGGNESAGYTEPELRTVLRESYGLSGDAIDAAIQAAKKPTITTNRI